MSVQVDLDELVEACEWVTAGESIRAEAYIRTSDGKILWRGDGIDDDVLPEGAEKTKGAYVEVPHGREFDLGTQLVFRFVKRHLPGSFEEVERYFHKRGAYARFKSMLDEADQLDQWHAFEGAAKEDSLTAWAVENGFVAVKKTRRG